MDYQDVKSFYETQTIDQLKSLRGRKWLALQEGRNNTGLFGTQDRVRLLQQIIWIDQAIDTWIKFQEARP